MPFPSNKTYGVLSGVIQNDEGERTSGYSGMSHFNLIVSTSNDDSGLYQVNIDIQSNSYQPNVLMYKVDNFAASQLVNVSSGFTPLSTGPGGQGLDLIRQPLFDINKLANAQPQQANDISAVLNQYLADGQAIVVYGTMYDDSRQDSHNSYRGQTDRYVDAHMYGARRSREQSQPPRGVDDVHLNQGTPNSQSQAQDNGTYQDGALLVQLPDNSYTAFFFAFSGQCFNTDDQGNCAGGSKR